MHQEEVIAGVVYDPLRNELFTAIKGAGAQLDGRRIRVSENAKLRDALLVTGFPFQGGEQTKRWLKSFATILPRAQSVHRNGASVLDLAYIACGRYDEIAGILRDRYAGLADRVTFPMPDDPAHDEQVAGVIAQLRA